MNGEAVIICPLMPPELFPFRFFDTARRRWIRARYKATKETIAARYEQWEIIGPGWTPPDLGGTASELKKEK